MSAASVVSAPPSPAKDIKDLSADTSTDTMARGPDRAGAEGLANVGHEASVRASVRSHVVDIADEKADADTMDAADTTVPPILGTEKSMPSVVMPFPRGGRGRKPRGS